jgi:serralysin
LDGGAGSDTAVYLASNAGVQVNLNLVGAQSGGHAAGDTIVAVENVIGSNFADFLTGNGTANVLNGVDGDDVLTGGAGTDTLIGGNHNDTFRIAGTEGMGDVFNGGAGTDTLQVIGAAAVTLTGFNASASSIEQWQGNGHGLNGTGAANTFNLSGLTSKSGLPYIDGGAGNDTLIGSQFADFLVGNADNDTLVGLTGADLLRGGLGRDYLLGGTYNDTFDFNTVEESLSATRDVIGDFTRSEGDKIDLSSIDAVTTIGGDQAFQFIGSQGFHGQAGELHYVPTGGPVIVEGDVNGDGNADFQIAVNGVGQLLADDFVL